MFGSLDIEVNAGHPNLPLSTVYAVASSPLTIRVCGVPAAQGAAKVTAVTLAVTYPDETTEEVKCVAQTDGSWVGTLAGNATLGTVTGGLKVVADGTNEQGAAVVGWVLGFGDLQILDPATSVEPTPSPSPSPTIHVDPIDDRYTMKDVKEKVNELISKLSSCLVFALVVTSLFTASAADSRVTTAKLEELYNDSEVVTAVDLSGISVEEKDPTVAITNGTIYIHGSTVTPVSPSDTRELAEAKLSYAKDFSAVSVSVGAEQTLVADLTDWPDGQAQIVFITLATGASVHEAIQLVGYPDWVYDRTFAASALLRNKKVYISPLFGIAE